MSVRDVRRHVGQLLIGSFEGVSVPAGLRSLARDFDLGGITLFGRHGNIESPHQVAELAYEARGLGREWPAWVAVDQEGGRVARLGAPFTEWPPMAVLGRADNEGLAVRFARALARELRAVGISLDYAPVLDIHTNPANPVIGDRALSDRADRVARFGSAIIRTIQQEGLVACGKHFPGHGDTSADSHLELPLVEHPPDRLRAVEWVPFRAAIAADVGSIMTAHVLVPSLDAEHPATLSRTIVQGVLREELGFQGVIISDDLEMRAVADHHTAPDAAVAAIDAGCDALLLCGASLDLQVAVLERLIHAVESETLALKRVEDALARNCRLKERMLTMTPQPKSPLGPGWKPPSAASLRDLLGCSEHQAVAAEMAQHA
jgi:beta-N-acetylhexosaminidase